MKYRIIQKEFILSLVVFLLLAMANITAIIVMMNANAPYILQISLWVNLIAIFIIALFNLN